LATRRHRAPEVWAEKVERQGHGTIDERIVGGPEKAREMLLMGLRLTEGIDAMLFAERTGMALDAAVDADVLQQAVAEGYLEWQSGRLAALPEGRLRLDALLAALVR
jgi:oxygen-independent coproporphyrinogen-3 oxidase